MKENKDAIFFDRAMYNQGTNAKYDPQILMDGTASTLVARGPGGVCVRSVSGRGLRTRCDGLQVGTAATSHGRETDR